MYRLLWIAIGFLPGLAPACGAEGEWSRFRGPNGSGVSNATTIPVRWTPRDYNWKITLPGPGYSSPVVWGHRVLVTCGDPHGAARSIVAIDARDGHTLWRRDYPAHSYPQHGDNDYASATPAVDAAGVVLTWTTPEQVMLLALDLEGRELWRRELGPLVSVQGSGSSPIFFDDLAVLANDQEDPSLLRGHKTSPLVPPGKSFLIAVDRKTGKTRWQTPLRTSYEGYATPCVYQAADGRRELIFTNTANGISGIDPRTGKVNWEYGKPFLDRAIASPIVAPGLVIAGHGSGLRASRYVAVHPGSIEPPRSAELVYEIRRVIPLVPTPVLTGGRLFLWTDDGVVACRQAADGKVIWQERVGGAYYGSPVWVDHRLYAMSRSGEVVVVAAGDKFEVLARVPLGEPTFSTPAVAGGVMYLRTRTHLFSLGGTPRTGK